MNILIIDKIAGDKLIQEFGSLIQYRQVTTSLGTFYGFSKSSMNSWEPVTVYLCLNDIQYSINNELNRSGIIYVSKGAKVKL